MASFVAFVIGASALVAAQAVDRPLKLGPPQVVARGVALYALDTTDLSTDGARQSVRLLRIDPAAARLDVALARDQVIGTEPVATTAARHGAVAAVNAGFFARSGDPTGLLRIDGQLVSESARAMGAVAIDEIDGRTRLTFDQVSARLRVRFRVDGRWDAVPVDGVDTPVTPNRLALLSRRFDRATGSVPGTTEWVLEGDPLVPSKATTTGNSTIPVAGFVLAFGGPVPQALATFDRADRVELLETTTPASGDRVDEWRRVPVIVGGAGLLARDGAWVADWEREQLATAFITTRHPRTVIGRDRDEMIWLVTVDGRQPDRAAGMSFGELQALVRRLGLVDALNLDGGGSTTMVVSGVVVNRPSDVTGPRPVSHAILVTPR